MTLGERIKEVRKINKLTQTKFGEIIHIGPGSVSRLESGENNPSDQTINLICREFNIREEWLRTGDGEMNAPDILDDIIKEQGLEGDAAELTRRFARVFASLRPETQHELLANFDKYFNPSKEDAAAPASAPRNVHDWTREEMDAEYKRQMDAETADREKGTSEPSTGSLSESGADCA